MKSAYVHFKVKKSSDSHLSLELVVPFMRQLSGVSDSVFEYTAERERLNVRDLAIEKSERKYGQALAYCNTALHVSNGTARVSAAASGGRRVVAAFMRIIIREAAARWKESQLAASCGPSLMHIARSRKPTQLDLGYRRALGAPTPAWNPIKKSPPPPPAAKPVAIRRTVED